MWRLRENAHPILTDDGGAILDERTGRWLQLTPTAAAAVMALCESTTVDEAAGQYAARYGLPPEQAAADIAMVAEALVSARLAVTGAPVASRSAALRQRLGRRWRR